MKIEGVEYRFQIFSDIPRDGLGLECYRQTESGEEFLFEVFRSDVERTYIFSPAVSDLPLSLIEYVAGVARDKLGSFVP